MSGLERHVKGQCCIPQWLHQLTRIDLQLGLVQNHKLSQCATQSQMSTAQNILVSQKQLNICVMPKFVLAYYFLNVLIEIKYQQLQCLGHSEWTMATVLK